MRRVLAAVAAGLVLVSVGSAAAADWPQGPVRLLVGAGPGGGTDVVTRVIAEPLGGILDQPVVVENRVGAASMLAANDVAKGPKDGSIAYMMNNAHAVLPALYKTLPFDPITDFQMVSLTATAGLVLVVGPSLHVTDVAGLIAAARAAPGKINVGSVGIGTTQYFAGELFRQLAQVDVVNIPHRTTPEVITAMRQGEVQLTFELIPSMLGQIRAGTVRALAVTSAERFPLLPDVPTVAESGLPGFEVRSWYGVAFPAGTAQAIVARMNAALGEALAQESVRRKLIDLGAEPRTSTPEAMRSYIAGEIAKWRSVREKAGIPQH